MYIGDSAAASAELLRLANAGLNENGSMVSARSRIFNQALENSQQAQNNQNVSTRPAEPAAPAQPGSPSHPDNAAGSKPGTGISDNSGPNNAASGKSPASPGSSGSSTATTAAATARPGMPGSMFNAQGNLSSGGNLQDFALLNSKQVLMQQALTIARTINTTQAAVLQPSIMIQLGMLQKLYELSLLNNKRKTTAFTSAANTSAQAAQSTDEMAPVLSFVFLERAFKLLEQCKSLHLSRFFKKGPLGEHLHEENTDDEYGSVYADVDAETDYIKRPRREKKEMTFHYSMLT